jgi:hypothetical protein
MKTEKQKKDWLIIVIISILTLLFLIIKDTSAQRRTTLLTEVGTTDFKNNSYAGMIGFTNFQDDSFHAGLLYKDYSTSYRVGVRVNVDLNLNRTFFVFIQSDIFAKTAIQDNASFMENSAGLGARIFGGLSLNLGYQMEVYDPVTTERREDQPNLKVSYKFGL